MYHTLFIQSSIKRYFGCLYVLVTMNNAAMNIAVYISLQVNVFEFFG